MMQVLMQPLTPGEAPRTTFLVKDLLYVPRTIYKIMTKTLCPIKGRNSDTHEVIDVMKNLPFYIIHGIPFDIQEFFMRTLITYAQSPFDLKPYAPWIMRLIKSRSSINYEADKQNHLSYVPPVELFRIPLLQFQERAGSLLLKALGLSMVNFVN